MMAGKTASVLRIRSAQAVSGQDFLNPVTENSFKGNTASELGTIIHAIAEAVAFLEIPKIL